MLPRHGLSGGGGTIRETHLPETLVADALTHGRIILLGSHNQHHKEGEREGWAEIYTIIPDSIYSIILCCISDVRHVARWIVLDSTGYIVS